jgi:hypothetical protein
MQLRDEHLQVAFADTLGAVDLRHQVADLRDQVRVIDGGKRAPRRGFHARPQCGCIVLVRAARVTEEREGKSDLVFAVAINALHALNEARLAGRGRTGGPSGSWRRGRYSSPLAKALRENIHQLLRGRCAGTPNGSVGAPRARSSAEHGSGKHEDESKSAHPYTLLDTAGWLQVTRAERHRDESLTPCPARKIALGALRPSAVQNGTVKPFPGRYAPELRLTRKESNMGRLALDFFLKTRQVLGRSFFPFFAITVILGAMLWGPWVSLAVVVVAVSAALRLI